MAITIVRSRPGVQARAEMDVGATFKFGIVWQVNTDNKRGGTAAAPLTQEHVHWKISV